MEEKPVGGDLSSMLPTPGKNPNCRNSELNDPLRRSFSGRHPLSESSVMPNSRVSNSSPNTPASATSPGLHRRDIISRERFSSFTDFDDKENREGENELKHWRSIRSPVPSKSNKNCMSSTISTAFKRKNLLVERNEEEFSLDYLKTGLESMMLKDDRSTADGEDLVNLDPTFKISPRVSFSPVVEVWAPADPDQSPSPPPYDPKVNYLSPRPQFLYYRKNNRIEVDEESFQYESSSDMDDSEEEEEQSDDELQLDDVATSCEVTEPNKKNKKLHVFEPFPMSSNKGISRPASFLSPKFMALLIALALTYLCISSTDLATFAPLQFEGLAAFKYLQIPFKLAKVKFGGYFERLQDWLADVRSYVLANISGLSRDHVPISVMHADLCSLPEYTIVSNYNLGKLEDRNMEELEFEANDACQNTETRFSKPGNNEAGVVHAYEEGWFYVHHHDALVEEQSSTEEKEIRGIGAEKVEVIDHPLENETEGEHVQAYVDGGVYLHHDALAEEQTTEEEEIQGIETDKVEVIDRPPENETKDKDASYLVSEDMLGDLVSHVTEPKSEDKDASVPAAKDLYSGKATKSVSEVFGDKFSPNYYYIPIISLLVLVLIVPPFMKISFLRKGKLLRTSPAVPTTEQAFQTQKHGLLTKLTTIDHKANKEHLPSSGWPSQMSTSHKNKLESSREGQSLIRRPGQQSLGYSDSPSYGSFTIYERIPNNTHGSTSSNSTHIATPVRRSSRIRNRIASS